MTAQQPERYEMIKEVIPCQTLFIDQNVHHLYLIRQNGTSDLIAVFKFKRDAKAFKELLSRLHTPALTSDEYTQGYKRGLVDGNVLADNWLKGHNAAIARTATLAMQSFVIYTKVAALKHGEMVDLMRRNNLKLDDLNDPMQKLAFTFFSEIGELSHKADMVIEEYEDSLRQQEHP
jgi:hypothetical protein